MTASRIHYMYLGFINRACNVVYSLLDLFQYQFLSVLSHVFAFSKLIKVMFLDTWLLHSLVFVVLTNSGSYGGKQEDLPTPAVARR